MIFWNESFKKKMAYFIVAIYLVFDFAIVIPGAQAKNTPQGVSESKTLVGYNSDRFAEGNAVEISVYPDTTSFLNDIYPIDGDGYVFLPIIGKVKITPMKKGDFRDYLMEAFTDYLKFPNIQVRSLIRVSILGGVAKPGLYYVDPANSFWNVVKLAGGTLDEDGLKKMKWKRNNKNVSENLIPILQSGQSLEQIGFHSGDQIWIPTPNKPGFLDKFTKYSAVLTFGISAYILYYSATTGRRLYYR